MEKEREELIQEKIKEQEMIEMIQLQGVKQKVWEILTKEKGFTPQDIEIEPTFTIQLSNCESTVSIDFIINLSSISFMVIRSVPTAIESWERYTIAFARAIKDYQIPYAVVTDGDTIKIFDVFSGFIIRKSLSELFSRQEALSIIKDFKRIPCNPDKLEKEKRIIYAFEGIKCPVPNEKK